MFVAPLSVPPIAPAPRGAHARRPHTRSVRLDVRVLLVAWLTTGAFALALLPSLRGDAAFGATLPFWLVAAPAIDLAWLMRTRLRRALRAVRLSRLAPQARRQSQSVRSMRADRSSRK